jgi:DNA-binding transcriptional ArsR family regulator
MCRVPEEIRAAILEHAKRGSNVYSIAREMGVSYGAIQWWLSCLERKGVVKTVKVGRRRYVVLASRNPSVLVEDLLEELRRAVRGLEQVSAERAVEILEERGLRHVAEALRAIMVARLQEAV